MAQVDCMHKLPEFIDDQTLRALAGIDNVTAARMTSDGESVTLTVDKEKVDDVIEKVRALGLKAFK